jgi:hypothetical protein
VTWRDYDEETRKRGPWVTEHRTGGDIHIIWRNENGHWITMPMGSMFDLYADWDPEFLEDAC